MQCNRAGHFALGGAAVDSASARSRYSSSGSALLQQHRTGSPRGASSKRMRLRQPPPWKTAITRRPLVLDDSCNHADPDPAAARARTQTQTTCTLAPNTTAAVACDVLKPVISPEAALTPRASCLLPLPYTLPPSDELPAISAAAMATVNRLLHPIEHHREKKEGARKPSGPLHDRNDSAMDKPREEEKRTLARWEAQRHTLSPDEIDKDPAQKAVGHSSKVLRQEDFELIKTLGTGAHCSNAWRHHDRY